MKESLKEQESGKTFAGIAIPVGLTRVNFTTLYLTSWIMGCLMALPAIVQPAFLKETIGIPEGLAGSINSGLQNMSQVATLLLIGLVGIASDRYGRKILIIAGFVICCIFFIVFGHSKTIVLSLGIESLAGQLSFVYLSRFIIGIGLVLSHPQFITMVADYTFERGRGKGMVLHAIMMSLGTLTVYGILARLATSIGVLGLLYIGGLLGLWGALIARIGLVERMPGEKAKKAGIKHIYRVASKNFALKLSYAAALITRADIAIPSTLLIVWMVTVADAFGYTPVEATVRGGIFLMVGSIFRLISFPAVGVLLDRVGRTPVLIATLIMGGVGYLMIATVENPFSYLMVLYICLLGLGKNGAIVAVNTLASDAAPKPLRGSILGGLNTLGTLGIILFLQAGGYLFDNISHQSPFLFKGVVNLLFGIWVWRVRTRVSLSSYTTGSMSGGRV